MASPSHVPVRTACPPACTKRLAVVPGIRANPLLPTTTPPSARPMSTSMPFGWTIIRPDTVQLTVISLYMSRSPWWVIVTAVPAFLSRSRRFRRCRVLTHCRWAASDGPGNWLQVSGVCLKVWRAKLSGVSACARLRSGRKEIERHDPNAAAEHCRGHCVLFRGGAGTPVWGTGLWPCGLATRGEVALPWS
jgi:hypothetical protein